MKHRIRTRTRLGTTLLELIIALVLLSLLTAVVSVAAHRTSRPTPDLATRVDSLRERAFRSGRPQRAEFHDAGRYGAILVLPTGRIIADSTLRVDTFTGDLRQ